MFPIHVLKSEKELAELPATGTYYLITADGVMEHKVRGMVRSITPTNKIPYLLKVDPAAAMLTPPIPPEIAYTALLFFRAVFLKHRTESVLMLFYSLDERKFRLVCPNQEVAYARVEYKPDKLPGWVFAGTIHSHCDFQAGHSPVDTTDEEYDDGFHATFGHVDKNVFTVATTIVAGQMRFPQDPVACVPSLRYARMGSKTEFIFDPESISGIDPESQIVEWLSKVKSRNFKHNTLRRRRTREELGSTGFSSFQSIFPAGEERDS